MAERHGSQEFGKDFVFSELHRLGGIRHYACQVKHEEKINQGLKVDGLLSQIKQAFATPFILPDSPRERFVSAVYVFNSGEITSNAETQITSELRRERYGDNVHFFDGQRLADLDRWSTYQEDKELRQRLNGLLLQTRVNLNHWTQALNAARQEKFIYGSMPFLQGIESFLTLPVRVELLPLDLLLNIWTLAVNVEEVTKQHSSPIASLKEKRARDIATVVQHTTALLALGTRLIQSINNALTMIRAI